MIAEATLRRKGWSSAEITHLQLVVEKADTTRGKAIHAVERATLALLAILVIAGAAGTGVALANLSLLDPWWFGAGVALVIGALVGALGRHGIRMLAAERHHALLALGAIVLVGGLACAATAFLAGGLWFSIAPAFAFGLLCAGLIAEASA